MKKPRKSKAKAKHRAARPPAKPAALPVAARPQSRGYTQARVPSRRRAKPVRLDDIVRAARRRLDTARTSAAGFATTARGRAMAQLQGLARRVTLPDVGPRLARVKASVRTPALPYSDDERQVLLLVFLPFLLIASAMVMHQSVRNFAAFLPLSAIATPESEITAVRRPDAASGLPLAAVEHSIAREAAPAPARAPSVSAPELPPAHAEASPLPSAPPTSSTAQPVSAAYELAQPVAPRDLEGGTPPLASLPSIPPPAAPKAELPTELALLSPAMVVPPSARPLGPSPVDTFEADDSGNPLRPGICSVAEAANARAEAQRRSAITLASLTSVSFGERLAETALSQVGQFVIYTDAYRRIAYPMGDVHELYGVCTDVIVRAYRALGIDLQELVQKARAGRGDRSIDHRRTEVLRRFFSAQGDSLPISSFAEDYLPGDIVTYNRPQNRGSRSHIAIVSSVIAPSGRPMIIHNRGWGPQLEDALFVDEITGHYRYSGPDPSRNAAKGPAAHHAGIGTSAPRARTAPEPTSLQPTSLAAQAN